jgi:hypothetical protein
VHIPIANRWLAGLDVQELQQPGGAPSNGPLLDCGEAPKAGSQPEPRASYGLQASPSETPFSSMLNSLKAMVFQRSPSMLSYRRQGTKLLPSLEATRELNSTMNKARTTAR